MKTIIALLSTGKGTWTEVINILKSEEWDKIFIVTNDFGKDKFSFPNMELIICDFNKPINEIRDSITEKLKGIPETEIAVNISSGTGKEHTALISAILKAGLGPRFVYYEELLREA
jgi:hypothetical protein